MRIRINTEQDDLSDELRAYIEHRLLFALSRFAPKTRQITVDLGRERSKSGSESHCCRIRIRLPRSQVVCVEIVDANAETAVARAAERSERAVALCLDRNREMNRPKSHSIR